MAGKTLKELGEKMRGLDITMLVTRSEGGALAGRPMSNNGDVDYDGTSYFFTWDGAGMVKDIEHDPAVQLSYQGADYFFVSVQGQAQVIRDRTLMADHWTPELSRWFKDGLETPGVVMLRVEAKTIGYWDGDEEGEITL